MENEKGSERGRESVADVTGNGKAVSGQLKESKGGEAEIQSKTVAKLREFRFEKLRNLWTFIPL